MCVMKKFLMSPSPYPSWPSASVSRSRACASAIPASTRSTPSSAAIAYTLTAFSESPGSGSGIRYRPSPRLSTPGSAQAYRSACHAGGWLVTWSTEGTSLPVNVPGSIRSVSRAKLRAVGVHRAAGGDRAGPAAGVDPGAEHRPGHAGGHRVHQILRPLRRRVVGQRALPLHPRPRGETRLPDLDQFRAARFADSVPLERAEQHGQLIDAELRVPV